MPHPLQLRRRTAAAIGFAVLFSSTVLSGTAGAAQTCGTPGGHTVCITVPDGSLAGPVTVTISNTPNTGTMVLTWFPAVGRSARLMTRSGPSAVTGDYSFVWPTQKYLDGSGTLRANIGPSTPLEVRNLTLSNGNTTDFQHTPDDWQSFLPGPWTAGTDPVVGAVGDGADDRPVSNTLAASITAANPSLFLYLGDIYEDGTFTENLNFYGVSSMDGTAGTLLGSIAHKTQPTLGNHERPQFAAWTDYWHGRPKFDSFTFGGVLFLNLNDTSTGFATGGPQYAFVEDALGTAPPCVVAFWHAPALSGGAIATNKAAMWSLLANNGGDLVLNGHNHFMTEYQPLDAAFQPGGHMVELISGAGGHKISNAKTDPGGRIAWAPVGKPSGTLYLTLNGAANGGAATGINWSFKQPGGQVLRTGSVTC